MRKKAKEPAAKKDPRTRQHLMERSFARAVRRGFKRARWRRLWRVQIQEYLTAAIQDILILIRYVKEPGFAKATAMPAEEKSPHDGLNTGALINLISHMFFFAAV